MLVFLLYCSLLPGQSNKKIKLTGRITYLSSQNLYVNFENTNGIESGDTLYLNLNQKLIPAVKVDYISSKSCAGQKIYSKEFPKEAEIIAFAKIIDVNPVKTDSTIITAKQDTSSGKTIKDNNLTKASSQVKGDFTEKIKGRLSLQSYSNLTNVSSSLNYQNWRYTFSIDAENIADSKFSISNYTSFAYRADNWNALKSDLGQVIRIYDLALKYSFDKKTSLWFGRYLNGKISNISSVDGIQFERYFGSYYTGVALGSRPNFDDMGYNIKLLEGGIYFGKMDSVGNGTMENTFSIFQQTNDLKTDRRFLYLQHSDNNILSHINFFVSSEVDLYKKINGLSKNDFSLTSLFAMTRYAPVSQFSISLFYDARKNIIYYETYKSFIDQLIDQATRQGLRARINLRPFNMLYVGLDGGYRYEKGDVKPTRNFAGYLSISRIPIVNINLSLSFTKLLSGYVEGNIEGIRISKYLFNDFVSVSAEYRKINYTYSSFNYKTNNNSLDGDLSINISKYLSLNLNYEGEFEDKSSYNRIFFGFTTRF